MNNSMNWGSTASGAGADASGWVITCALLACSNATVASGPNFMDLAASPSGSPKSGTRANPSSASALMHISALSNMYQGSLRPFCNVSM